MRPIAACGTFVLFAFALCTPLRAAGDGDNQLARVAGTVQYQAGADPAYHAVFGKIDLSEALAVTLAQSRAQVILPDSSSIDVGATTRVRLGAFNAAATGNPNVVVLELGALHFNIRHPAGGRATIVFKRRPRRSACAAPKVISLPGPVERISTASTARPATSP
jgi:hypothetical protein